MSPLLDLAELKDSAEFKDSLELVTAIGQGENLEENQSKVYQFLHEVVLSLKDEKTMELKKIKNLIKIADNYLIKYKDFEKSQLGHLISTLHQLTRDDINWKTFFFHKFDESFAINIDSKQRLDVGEFYKSYYKESIPVFITESSRKLLWTMNEIAFIFENRYFPVEIGDKYTSDDWEQQIMSMKDFFQTFMVVNPSKIGYIAQFSFFQLNPGLKKDFTMLDYAALSENEVEVNFWLGPANTISPFHYDNKDNIFWQQDGAKQFFMLSPIVDLPLCPGFTNTSLIKPSEVQKQFKHKLIQLTILPGQILYIPKGWWHYVQSITPSLSISNWF
ncbi:MAG: Lysine-specific demethylase 8 [Paramarteilia canceri]